MSIETAFETWSKSPETKPAADLQQRIESRISALEKRINEVIELTDVTSLTQKDEENFYRLLGGFRGVFEAIVAYAGVAGAIDWNQWREEMFS